MTANAGQEVSPAVDELIRQKMAAQDVATAFERVEKDRGVGTFTVHCADPGTAADWRAFQKAIVALAAELADIRTDVARLAEGLTP